MSFPFPYSFRPHSGEPERLVTGAKGSEERTDTKQEAIGATTMTNCTTSGTKYSRSAKSAGRRIWKRSSKSIVTSEFTPTGTNSKQKQVPKAQQNTEHALERKTMLQEQRLKKQMLQREQCCAPGSMNDYAKLRKRQVEWRAEQLHSFELPLTTLAQEEDYENTFGLAQESGFKQGLPSSTILPEALMDNQNDVDYQNDIGLECHVENQESTPKVAEKKKHRGPTIMVKVHQRSYQECKGVTLNQKGQPIGPPSVVRELASFLGMIAEDPTLAPINIVDWKFIPTKEDIWSYVKEKYRIDELGKKHVLETINEDWRVYKSRLKNKHYKPYNSDEESQKHDDVHTMGPCCIASLRYELERKNPNQLLSDSLLYKESRKRNPTHAYKTDGCKTKENIDKMNDLQVQIEKGEKDDNVDPFFEVISTACKGRLILRRKGLKVSSKGKEKKGGYILDEEFYETMKVEWVEEVMPTLVSKILTELQEAYPHMNFKEKNFKSIPECSTQTNSLNDAENRNSPQDEHVDEEEDVEDEVN
ncbi:hypothetical protein V2J09_009823 [Rumex salicifolius]